MSTPALAIPAHRVRGSRIGSYVALTKPRIIELLLVTTLPTMIVAKRGFPSIWLMVATLVGGALAAGGANAINMVVDRDIDSVMHRTRNRPLVTGAMTPRAALIFVITLEVAAFVVLWLAVILLSAVLAGVAQLSWLNVAAAGLGAGVFLMATCLWDRGTPRAAMRLSTYSITYLTLLFVVIAVQYR